MNTLLIRSAFLTGAVLILGCQPSPAPQVAASAAPVASAAAPCAALEGQVGTSDRWGSGWLDLKPPAELAAGSHLRVTVGGTATKVLVRLLRQGESPDSPSGVLGVFAVPADRIVDVTLKAATANVVQISVHGSPKPWSWDLGSSNGPANLSRIEHCK